jgi:biopolymer transport protein ExbD
MEEESLHLIPILEKRINYILMLGNVSTLIGLMGTIFGLILSFAAVARPDVDPVEKSSLLAAGISTAMNTTLLGLMISVPCVMIFSLFRSKVDNTIQEIDRYAASLLKVLLPTESVRKEYRVTGSRIKEAVDTEPNIAPMMNLMVILIPLLLSSAEFVKIGAIELKLPESSGGGGGGGGSSQDKKDVKLDLGIVISERGFDLFHYFKEPEKEEAQKEKDEIPDKKKAAAIPKKNGEYDFEELNAALATVKKKALFEIIRTTSPGVPRESTLLQLFNHYKKNDYRDVETFKDFENVKIVAEEEIKYETVVSVMDAARGTKTPHGNVTMFPNVSLAGGIIY